MESAKFPQWSQVGTAGAMQVPVVGLQPLRSVEQPGADDIFFAPSMWMVNSSRRSLSRQVRSLDGVCRLSSACLLRLAKAKVCPGCPGCPVAPCTEYTELQLEGLRIWKCCGTRNFLLRVLQIMEATDGCLWLCGLPNQSQMHSLWNCVFFPKNVAYSIILIALSLAS